MDKAKLRLLAGVSGAVFGFAGVLALSAAVTMLLANWMPLWVAGLSTGGLLFLVAALCVLFFLDIFKSADEELDQFEDATADMLADLPFDTISAIVEKRPVTALGIAALVGYAATSDPDRAVKNAERVMFSLL
tara:strand:+ start:60282 stop:60680 length:399 start_codon:yes stop_codon:yes gene_type:complete